MNDPQKLKEIMAKNIKAQLKKKRITQTDLAKDLNLPEMTVSNWINAKTYPRVDKIQMLADYFNIYRSDLTEEKLTNIYEASPQTVKVPILGVIACGDPILVEENFAGYRYYSPDSLPSGETFVVETKGNSMEPSIPNGSFVLMRKQSDVENGEIAAVLLNDDAEVTLKRVKKQGDLVMLMPDNPTYEPIIVNEDNPAKILGKAISYSRDL